MLSSTSASGSRVHARGVVAGARARHRPSGPRAPVSRPLSTAGGPEPARIAAHRGERPCALRQRGVHRRAAFASDVSATCSRVTTLFPHLTAAETSATACEPPARGTPTAHRKCWSVWVSGDSKGDGGRSLSGQPAGDRRPRPRLAPSPRCFCSTSLLRARCAAAPRAARGPVGVLRDWGTAAVVVTHDFTRRTVSRTNIVVYDGGRVGRRRRARIAVAAASEIVAASWVSATCSTTVLKASPDRIRLRWRGYMLEAVNSPTHSYLPPPDSPIAFSSENGVRAAHPQGCGTPIRAPMNLMSGVGWGRRISAPRGALRFSSGRAGRAARATTTSRWRCRTSCTRSSRSIAIVKGEFSIHRGSSTSCPPDGDARAVAGGIAPAVLAHWSLTLPALDIHAARCSR